MRKGFEIFSAEEFAAIKSFANNAVKEDRKIHGVSDKDAKTNKTKNLTSNFYNQEKSKTVATNNFANKPNQFSNKKDDKKPLVNPTIKKPVEKNPPSSIKKE